MVTPKCKRLREEIVEPEEQRSSAKRKKLEQAMPYKDIVNLRHMWLLRDKNNLTFKQSSTNENVPSFNMP